VDSPLSDMGLDVARRLWYSLMVLERTKKMSDNYTVADMFRGWSSKPNEGKTASEIVTENYKNMTPQERDIYEAYYGG